MTEYRVDDPGAGPPSRPGPTRGSAAGTRRRKIILAIAVVILAAGAIAGPHAWRAGALYWAKSSARRTLNKLPADTRRNLNATPTRIELTATVPDRNPIDSVEFKDDVIHVLRPTSRSNPSPRSVALNYPRYKVIILRPTSTAEGDALAQQLHSRCFFEEFSAANHTRLDDLDAQPDVPSVKRFLLLMSLKLENIGCHEEFTCGDICGFIIAPLGAGKRTVVEVFVPAPQKTFGLWFYDDGGLTMDDIHDFLRALRFVPKQPGDAGVSSTAPNERPAH